MNNPRNSIAASHFPGQPLQVMALPKQPVKEARLLELLRLNEAGRSAVESRLCLCGECRLPCRSGVFPGPSADGIGLPQASASKGMESLQSTGGDRSPFDEKGGMVIQRVSVEPIPSSANLALKPENLANLSIASEEESSSEEEPDPSAAADNALIGFEAEGHDEMEGPELAAGGPGELSERQDLLTLDRVDGKVSCQLCGKRMWKHYVKFHVELNHMSRKDYHCRLCDHAEKTRGLLADHQKRVHGIKIGKDTLLFMRDDEELQNVLRACFGDLSSAEYERIRCKQCQIVMNKNSAKAHIGRHHIKQTMHRSVSLS